MKPAVFLDRDGVLVENIDGDYVRDKEQIKLLPYAKRAVAKLFEYGYQVIVVTNQACVGKRIIGIDAAWAIQNEVVDLLDPNRTMNLKSELCPHMSEEQCCCRKPQPGMILAAQKKYNLDLSKSYLVGDAISDIQASFAAKITPIFVLSGRGNLTDLSTVYEPIRVLDHIGDAADFICGDLR